MWTHSSKWIDHVGEHHNEQVAALPLFNSFPFNHDVQKSNARGLVAEQSPLQCPKMSVGPYETNPHQQNGNLYSGFSQKRLTISGIFRWFSSGFLS
jgi:hypothetical protein